SSSCGPTPSGTSSWCRAPCRGPGRPSCWSARGTSMPSAEVFDATGARTRSVELSEAVFGGAPNTALLHQAVVPPLAPPPPGTHDTLTRGEVARTTKKVWRQKGTGRARQGSRKAPHWRGGGVVFGPHPRSYRQDLPRKMRTGALRSALAAKAAAGEIVVLQDL